MTQKELLYVEDAIGHETNTIDIYYYVIENLEDGNLASFLKKLVKRHESIKEKLVKLLESECNER